MKKMFLLIFGIVFLAPHLRAVTTNEIQGSYGKDSMLQKTDDWSVIAEVLWWYNAESLGALTEIINKERAVRATAGQLRTLGAFKEIEQLIVGLKDMVTGESFARSSFSEVMTIADPNQDVNEYDWDTILKKIKLRREESNYSYISTAGKVEIIDFNPPVFIQINNNTSIAGRNRGARWGQFCSASAPIQLVEMLDHVGGMLLPENVLNRFDTAQAVRKLMAQFGIRCLGDGIYARPTVKQDWAFHEFANLGAEGTDRTLFWSDKMVVNGYTPVFGTALNQTILKGYRSLDADHFASNGFSLAIEAYNRSSAPKDRIKNPFRGFASRVIPGLIVMGEQGRLTPGENPSAEHLREAERLSKGLKMLPSQFLKKAEAVPVQFRKTDTVTQPMKANGFRFIVPPKVVRVNDGYETYAGGLSKTEYQMFQNRVKADEDRIREIAKLKEANRWGRMYMQRLIEAFLRLEGQVAGMGMSQDGAIPEVTQVRQNTLASIEKCRWMLSELHHQYSTLRHEEWEVIQHVLDLQETFTKRLMDSGSLRARTKQMWENYQK